jgi:phage baseplate assembly protein W
MAITPIQKKRILYTDFDKELTRHPVSNDVSRKINEESVKESIKNLILTDRGERPFQPEVGCDVRSLLFENVSEDTFANIRTMIETTIQSFEPRCELLGVDVTGRTDSNEVSVTITFFVINNEEATTLNILLNRVR